MNSEQLDRLQTLAKIGASHAAVALSQLTRRSIHTGSLRVCDVMETASKAGGHSDQKWSAGVFFELEGCIAALVCILFQRDESESLARQVLGASNAEASEDSVESVLTELGNIVASHLASAIADWVGGRLIPSVPSLVMTGAESELLARASERGSASGIRIDCELCEDSGEVTALIAMVPAPRTP